MRGMLRSALAKLVLLPILAIVPLAGAQPQDFPSRPVRFIVPYAAGGSGDLLARLLGTKLASLWGQQVVVDNRAGGGGLIGTEFAARSEPDGYTLYLATDGPLTIAATLYKRVPYDWKRDFAPVSMMAMGYQVLIVKPSLPAKSVQELALLAGDVDMFLVGTSTAVPHIQSGALRGLAVTAKTRVDGLPDVPTFAEAGLPGVDVSLWFAVLVPGGTPSAIIRKLNADIVQVVAEPEFKQALKARGFEAVSSTPEQLAAFMDKDYVKFRNLIQTLGLQVE